MEPVSGTQHVRLKMPLKKTVMSRPFLWAIGESDHFQHAIRLFSITKWTTPWLILHRNIESDLI